MVARRYDTPKVGYWLPETQSPETTIVSGRVYQVAVQGICGLRLAVQRECLGNRCL